jgi:hypothetical protein
MFAQPSPQETVARPDPGFARGKWEAPAWALWGILVLVILGAGAYVAVRVLKKRASKK